MKARGRIPVRQGCVQDPRLRQDSGEDWSSVALKGSCEILLSECSDSPTLSHPYLRVTAHESGRSSGLDVLL